MRRSPDPSCENDSVSPTPAQQARAAAIAAQIAELTAGFILPGTLTERMTRCGHPRCRCHADPPQLHGPYHQWTRKIAGKTVTRILTDDQLADYSTGSTTSAASASSSPARKTQPANRRRRPTLAPLTKIMWPPPA